MAAILARPIHQPEKLCQFYGDLPTVSSYAELSTDVAAVILSSPPFGSWFYPHVYWQILQANKVSEGGWLIV